jgi:hypothetical protein
MRRRRLGSKWIAWGSHFWTGRGADGAVRTGLVVRGLSVIRKKQIPRFA